MSKSIYRPKSDKKYRQTHKRHYRYLSYRSTAKTFVRRYAKPQDVKDLIKIWKNRKNNN